MVIFTSFIPCGTIIIMKLVSVSLLLTVSCYCITLRWIEWDPFSLLCCCYITLLWINYRRCGGYGDLSFVFLVKTVGSSSDMGCFFYFKTNLIPRTHWLIKRNHRVLLLHFSIPYIIYALQMEDKKSQESTQSSLVGTEVFCIESLAFRIVYSFHKKSQFSLSFSITPHTFNTSLICIILRVSRFLRNYTLMSRWCIYVL
jgi:hypothetical protein